MTSSLVNPHLEGSAFLWEAGPVGVLLSHGFTATAAEVRPLAERMLAHGYTVAGPLLAGHGTTPEDLNRCRWEDWVRSVEETYQQLAGRCQPIVVGGESMGALLALYLASEHPEVAGILTYAPALVVPRKARVLARVAAPFVAYAQKNHIDARSRWQGYPVNPVRAVQQLLRLQSEVRSRLAALHQPLLIVQGRLDTSIDLQSVDLLHRQAGSAYKEVHWMEHSTHVVILDQELDEVEAITAAFLQRVLNGPKGGSTNDER